MICFVCSNDSKMLFESVFDDNFLICADCKEKERNHHLYEKALYRAIIADLNNDFEFRGIGMPNDLNK